MNVITKCERCEDKGWYPAQETEDDFEVIYCACEKGRDLEFVHLPIMGKMSVIQKQADELAKLAGITLTPCIRCGEKDVVDVMHRAGENYHCEVCHDDMT